MTNQVAVVSLDKRYKKSEKELREKAEKALLFLKQNRFGASTELSRMSGLTTGGVAVEVYLVGSSKMKELNKQYRGIDKATNVLAFVSPRDFPKIKPRFLGEVYLCPAYIRTEGEDIQLLLTHGILHLAGFNHESVNDRITMERIEKKLSAWLNH